MEPDPAPTIMSRWMGLAVSQPLGRALVSFDRNLRSGAMGHSSLSLGYLLLPLLRRPFRPPLF